MTGRAGRTAGQVKALAEDEREEFLSWLAELELEHGDHWNRELVRDSQPGGRMERVLKRVRRDIAEGRTKPLDDLLDHS